MSLRPVSCPVLGDWMIGMACLVMAQSRTSRGAFVWLLGDFSGSRTTSATPGIFFPFPFITHLPQIHEVRLPDWAEEGKMVYVERGSFQLDSNTGFLSGGCRLQIPTWTAFHLGP